MKAISLMLLYLTYKVTEASSGAHWDYDHIHAWGNHYHTCGQGNHQSPIDINSGISSVSGSDPVLSINSHKSPSATLKNNGHTVQLDFTPGRYKVSGAHLPGTYVIDQLHFHWGSVDSKGSEHKIDGGAFPIEMHVVSHKDTYTSLGSAVGSGNSDALAVLGFLFEVSDESDEDDDDADNPELEPITDKLSSVLTEGSSVTVNNFDLEQLIKDYLKKPYFRYNGSLTTPPCSEVVVWTIFDLKLSLSGVQLDEFRNTGIEDNFRPTRPLNGRQVKHITYALHQQST